jgi:1,4-alpha-glucan branching enzyme
MIGQNGKMKAKAVKSKVRRTAAKTRVRAGTKRRATAAKATVTEFRIFAPQARKVHVAGSFNNWDASVLSARKDVQGNWVVKVGLKPGRYEYKFVVDGTWLNDPRCTQYVQNSFGSQNSVITVK